MKIFLNIRYYKCCYDRIGISEGIDPIKGNKSKECMIGHYWLFNRGFKFQDSVCNSCHDLTSLCLNISDTAIITVKNDDYLCIIYSTSKDPNCVHPWVESSTQNVVLRVSIRKSSKIFPCGPFLCVFLTKSLSKCPNSTKSPLP